MKVKNQYLIKDGKPFFYLADTCWSAFTNIEMNEWEKYCRLRSQQGFNVIQINLLRQWDASGYPIRRDPFAMEWHNDKYNYDYSRINEVYFDRVDEMLQIMHNYQLTPALVLLWANYVPGTWTQPMIQNNLFDKQYLSQYVSYVAKRFEKYEPIYLISGDTDFPTQETIGYYHIVLDTLKKNTQKSLISFHIKSRLASLPDQFIKEIDFFSYQSGHNKNYQQTAFSIPAELRKQGLECPIINTEPCYEQISYSRSCHEFGRFSREDVRRIAWQSVLSGANAGITYGAHGIWSWHKKGETFGVHAGEGFDVPYPVDEALTFQGANDYAFLKQLVLEYKIYLAEPLDIEFKQTSVIRIAKLKQTYFIYLPFNTQLDVKALHIDLNDYSLLTIDLDKRSTQKLSFQNQFIEMHKGQKDALYILKYKKE